MLVYPICCIAVCISNKLQKPATPHSPQAIMQIAECMSVRRRHSCRLYLFGRRDCIFWQKLCEYIRNELLEYTIYKVRVSICNL